MPSPLSLNLLPSHTKLWSTLQLMVEQNRLPQALLMVGPRHASVMSLVNRFVAAALCKAPNKPCEHCQMCRLFIQQGHPDVLYIQPDIINGAIKIEQIRSLQLDLYQMPQCGKHRFVLLSPADKLNQAAGNALLKILEEPPSHTIFILVTEQLNLPATILSRCQQYRVNECDDPNRDYLAIRQLYESSSDKKSLFTDRLQLIESLTQLVHHQKTPCEIASQWLGYEFEDLIRFLYLLTSKAIEYHILDGNINDPLYHFAKTQTSIQLFGQLDKIINLLKTLQQQITLNQTLAIEHLLLGYLGLDYCFD